jgi:HSP20 family protein
MTGANELQTNDATARRMVFQPRTDVVETEGAYEITADMPGVDRDAVEVTVDGGVLSVKGRQSDWSVPGQELAYAEFLTGDYRRDLALPEQVDAERIEATLKDGVLRLTLPKRAPAQTKRIAVKAA